MNRLVFIFLLFILISCVNKGNSNADFLNTASGFDYKIIKSKSGGDTIQKGDVVKLNLRQFADDSLLNDTYTTMPEYIKIDSTLRKFDFSEILPFMKINDSAVCVFPVSKIVGKAQSGQTLPAFLKNKKNINVYLIVLDKFSTDSIGMKDYAKEKKRYDSLAEMKEKAAYEKASISFDSLIKSVKQPLKKLSNGAYVQVIEEGKGGQIKKGDSIAVIYKGMLLDGTVFETTTQKSPFLLKAGEGESVEGLDSAISSLIAGSKAKIFIPAKLAYGANKVGNKIPAFSNLVFEVEVIRQEKK